MANGFKIVRCNPQGGVASIQFSIKRLLDWRYVYNSDDRVAGIKYSKSSDDPPPYLHALGHPHEVSGDADTWEVRLANRGASSQQFQVVLEWIQDGQVLETWTQEGTLAPGEATICRGNALIVSGAQKG